MNRLERYPDQETIFRSAQNELASRMWSAMPGIIETVNLEQMTCTASIAIQAEPTAQTGEPQTVTRALLVDMPIQFMRGGGLSLTLPFEPGDECLIVFADRCIDAWWQSGGVQPQASYRMHSLSDGFVLPGVCSQPRVLQNVSATSAQLRTDDGTAYVELTQAGVINLVGPVNITGAVTINGNVATTGTLTNNEIDVGSDHVHYVSALDSDSGVPKKGP